MTGYYVKMIPCRFLFGLGIVNVETEEKTVRTKHEVFKDFAAKKASLKIKTESLYKAGSRRTADETKRHN